MAGPLPGSQCVVCNHPQVAAINAAIAAGRPSRRVAADFGIAGKDSILRHVTNQHPGAPPKPAPRGSHPSLRPVGGLPRERLEALLKVLEAQAASGPVSPLLAQQLRQGYKDLDAMQGPPPQTEVRMRDVSGLTELLADLLLALEPFPDARRALSTVLEKHREALGG